MKIYEIEKDNPVTLEIIKENRSMELKGEVLQSTHLSLILKPIIMDGKVVNMETEGMAVNVIHERDGEKPLIWRNVGLQVFRHDNMPVVVLSDRRDGTVFNRRGTYRLDMDVKGYLNGGEKVVVHDISITGVSFFSENEKEIGAKIVLNFEGHDTELTVSGEIVRRQQIDDRVLYGCTIRSTIAVEKFISEEQQVRVRKRR